MYNQFNNQALTLYFLPFDYLLAFSYKIFNLVFNNKISSYLIKHDMDLHKAQTANVQELKNLLLLDILCLSYVAEVYANKELFGGESCENFKIKKKQMESKIKKIFS